MICVWITCNYQEVWEAFHADWTEVKFFEERSPSSGQKKNSNNINPHTYIWHLEEKSHTVDLNAFVLFFKQSKKAVAVFWFQVKCRFSGGNVILMAQTHK